MGRGIALVAALSGFRTKLYDVQQVMLWKSKEEIDKSLQLLQSKKQE
jgi:3-hydroxyacyl-CoA dehydrogenase, NAD binding domain.